MLNTNKMIVKWVRITPTMASEWLVQTNGKNRTIREDVVRRYACDMAEGRWRVTTTPIKFDRDNLLVDGQHRLGAITQSNVSLPFLVVQKCDPLEREVQDIGRPRSLRDILKFEDEDVSGLGIGTAARMMGGVRRTFAVVSMTQKREYFLKHQEAITFALDCAPIKKKKLARAALFAVIARAFYSVDHASLQRFVTVVMEGLTADPSEMAPIQLRHFLDSASAGQGGALALECYLKAERALCAFLEGQGLLRLFGVTEEQFLLPGEQPAEPGKGSIAQRMKKNRSRRGAVRKARLLKKAG